MGVIKPVGGRLGEAAVPPPTLNHACSQSSCRSCSYDVAKRRGDA
jgi:hypothetical protein